MQQIKNVYQKYETFEFADASEYNIVMNDKFLNI